MRRNSPLVPMKNQRTRAELKALPKEDLSESDESSSSLDSSDSNRCDPPISIPATGQKAKTEDLTHGKNFDCIINSTSGAILTLIPTKKLYFKPDNMNALLEINVEKATIYHDAGKKRAPKSASVLKVTNQYVINGCNPHAVRKLDNSRATGVSAQQNQTQYRPQNVLISNNETYIPPEFGGRNNLKNTPESNEPCRNFPCDVNSSARKNENNFDEVLSEMKTPTLYRNTGINSVIHDLFGSLLDNNGRDALPHDYYTDAEGLLYGNGTFQSSFAIEVPDRENFNIPTPSSSLGIQNDEGICSDSSISSNELNFKQADSDFTAFCDTLSPIIDDKSVIKNIPTVSRVKSCYKLAEEEHIPFNSSQSSANKNVSKGKVLHELPEESQSPSDSSESSDT
ncbi:hypothetical protein TNCT_607731 [Trichonephila clavata]|uniref:Uncharacterized protein n=1 Tax=Trichonephila clavata TaxID=2740835 RepID=A0A8X6G1L9_TRICU|nr:hypothetical protein TNCT_607731 [Trichonephila clavata]